MNFQVKLLALITLILTILIPFLLPYGAVTGDFPAYLKIASEIPSPSNNIFPFGFPLLIKIFSCITSEYFYSSLLLKILCFLSIIGFSVWKRFYITETIILLTLKATFWVFIHQGSEYASFPLLFIYIYFIYRLFNQTISHQKFILFSSIIAFLLLTIRYANSFVIAATFLFYILKFKHTKKYTLPIIAHLFLSGIFIGIYLLINQYIFGSFTGENNRINDEYDTFIIDTIYDFIGFINLFNPLYYLKPLGFITKTQIIGSGLLIAIDIVLAFFILRWVAKKHQQHQINLFEYFLFYTAIIIGCLTFIAAMFQGIEPLAQRLLANSFILLWFGLLILIRKTNAISIQKLICFAYLSLILQFIYNVRIPTNFMGYKTEIESVLNQRKSIPKFYYDDLKETKISVYHLPILNKEIKKEHEQLQPKNIQKAILRLNYPSIIILEEEPKSYKDVILSSDLKLKKSL